MRRLSNPRARRLTLLAIVSAMASGNLMAQVVTIRADKAPLNQLSNSTYGSGFGYINADMRVMFTDTGGDGSAISAQNAYDMLKGLNMGMYRFPGGNPSFWYRWDSPCGSAVAAPQPQCTEYLSPADVQKYFAATSGTSLRAPLGGNAMFQVNTVASWVTDASNNTIWKTVYQKVDTLGADNIWRSKPVQDGNNQYVIDDAGGLDQTAAAAGNWVKADRLALPAMQSEYWEIGNEDWARWTPQQYAKIFNAFATKMIAANGGTVIANGSNRALKLIAQVSVLAQDYTSTDKSNLGINQTAGEAFVTLFAAELTRLGFDLNNVYGVAVHPYLNGDQYSSLDKRTLAMYAKIDDSASEVQKTLINTAKANPKWKVLATEYNILEGKDSLGNTIPVQNKANAMILADWSANMLAHGVEKIMPYSLDSDPQFALFMYRNGYSLSSPRMMTTGAALARLTTNLQGTMYPVDIAGIKSVGYTNASGAFVSVAGLSGYAALLNKTLNVLLINRDFSQNQSITLQLTAANTTNIKAGGIVAVSTFGDASTSLATDNFTGNVNWSAPQTGSITPKCRFSGPRSPRTCTLSDSTSAVFHPSYGIKIPAGGMVHVQIPME